MDTLAVELVQLIALHLATPSSPSSSSPLPPKDLIPLLSTSRLFYYALNPRTNPHFYAQLFRRTFDTAALYRRFPVFQLTAPALTHEYIRRWTCLSRVRTLSTASGYAWTPRLYRKAQLLEDLMTLYLMFVESDGANARLVLQYANVVAYLDQFKHHRLAKMRLRPEMPEESEEVAVWLWLCWFTLDYYKSISEGDELRINFDYLITPFVLGVFQYANAYAPWACPVLPQALPSSPSSFSNVPSSPLTPTNPSPSPNDLIPLGPRPFSTAIPGGYLSVPAGTYNSSHGTNGVNGVSFAFPLLHHAAVQLCLAREDRLPIFQQGTAQLTPEELINDAVSHGLFPSATTLADPHLNSRPFLDPRTGRVVQDAYTPDYMRVKFPCIANSKRWDNEWARLVGCRDPIVPMSKAIDVPRYRWTPGRMTGDWDGRFMIPSLEGYNRLLDALQPLSTNPQHHAVREYPVNILEEVHRLQNFQSWNIVEYHHRPLPQLPNSLRPGRAINAHLPDNMVLERTAASWDPILRRWREGILVRANGVQSFYEAIPSSDTSSSTSIPSSASGLPILLFGRLTSPPHTSSAEPHNGWFSAGATISGIVRPWDGLITLKATGDPRAGDFVYNGYLLGEGDQEGESGNWVGRWRDAHSEAMRVAWEGVFVMRKRGE